MPATCRPTNPVAPVTATSTDGLGRGAAAFVEEYERAPARHDCGEGLEDLGIEHRAGEVRHSLHRPLRGNCLLVGPRGRECVKDFRGGDDSCGDGDRLAAEAVGVSVPVPALVVAAHAVDDDPEVRE